MEIAALNVSGNPLDPGELGAKHKADTDKTIELAGAVRREEDRDDERPAAGQPRRPHPELDHLHRELAGDARRTASTTSGTRWRSPTGTSWWEGQGGGVEKFALENFSSMLVWNPETLFRLRDAVGPMVGLNLDPSHLIWMGADPIASARALGEAIHHVHGKDVRLERGLVDVNGLLETKPVEDVANRAWNYVAVGCGRDLQWWKEFFSVVRMMGYNDWVSLEMEDLTMSVEAGIKTSIEALQQTISQ